MKKAALILPVLFLLVFVGAGCAQTGSVEVETDEGTASETQGELTRQGPAPRAEGSKEDGSVDEEESAEEEEEETSASASTASTAELEELADEVDSLLGGMEAGESGF